MLKDKSVEDVLLEVLPLAKDIIALEPPIEERKLPADELAKKIKEKGYSVTSQPNIQDALDKVNQIKDEYDVVIFTGSLYMLGPIRHYFTHLQS